MIWLFVRHGESVANQQGWLAGHQDVSLTEHGRDQARGVGRALALRPIDRAFCSDLERARETLNLVLGDRPVPLTVLPQLRERRLGDWEGRYRAELQSAGVWERLLGWTSGPPGGECQRDVAIRMLGCLAAIDGNDAPTTLVVSHGTALRTVIGLLDGLHQDEIGWKPLGNAELAERRVEPGTWGHLLADVQR